MRRVTIIAALVAAAAVASGCTERGQELTWGTAATLVDEGCQRGTSELGLAGRKEAVAQINARTEQGNWTASDCDKDGQPDFAIDSDGMPEPDSP